MEMAGNFRDVILKRANLKYPGWTGFSDPRFIEEEIEYKREASSRVKQLLAKETLRDLLAEAQYEQILDNLRSAARDTTNLLFVSMPSQGDLSVLHQDALDVKSYCEAAFDLLHGDGESTDRLKRYLNYLEENDLPSKWPLPTVWLFLLNPESEIVIKPRLMNSFLKRMGVDLKLRKPSADDYESFRQIAFKIRDTFSGLGAGDMIDVQSLIWIVEKADEEGKAVEDSFDSGIEMLRLALGELRKDNDEMFQEILEGRDEVIGRFGEVFSVDGLDRLTEQEFKSFLAPSINKHWSGINRMGGRITQDMARLKDALRVLLDESRPLEDRLVELRPPGGAPLVKGLGRSILTPILLVAYPDKYGVLNSVSEGALKELGLWPKLENGGQFTSTYPKVNQVLNDLADELGIDLWTLDALWWFVPKTLGPPFDRIFQDWEQALWAFRFMRQTFELLGATGPKDRRFSITLPSKHKGSVLRANFGSTVGLDFGGPDSYHHGVTFLLDKEFAESKPEFKVSDGKFARLEDLRHVSISFETARSMDASLATAYRESAEKMGDVFRDWKGTPYSPARRDIIHEAVYDEQLLRAVLSEGVRDVRYWKVAPGDQAWQWDECLEEGFITIGWSEFGDLTNVDEKEFEQIRRRLEKDPGYSKTEAGMVWNFCKEIRRGDVIVANKGTQTILGVGRVVGDYYYQDDDRGHTHRYPVDWYDYTERAVQEGGWRRTLIELGEEKFQRLMGDAPVPTDCPYSTTTFDLLQRLAKDPTRGFYQSHKADFDAEVESPTKSLFRSVASELPPKMLKWLETEKHILARIPKNDFGRGDAWPWYGGGFYPKGGKGIQDPQLYLTIRAERLDIGFYIGACGEAKRLEFAKRLKANRSAIISFLSKSFAERNFRFGVVEGEEADGLFGRPETLADWIDQVEHFEIRVTSTKSPAEVLSCSDGDLVEWIRNSFETLFPLMYLTESGDPIAKIQAYIGLEPEPEPVERYTAVDCARETGFPQSEIERWIRAIQRKGQGVLFGPPGTGKTFLAERLAKVLTSESDGFAETIQFHPSYSYEEFMEGIRPRADGNGNLTYDLEPGRFRQFCDRAGNREGPCVLIIDEINRANLSRVFGELMYLLEYRNEAVPLAAGTSFKIPSNVRIIGTMNTADRSIALVDHALRRRFAFIPLQPDMSILSRFQDERGFDSKGLTHLLTEMNRVIGDPHYEVGISFFLVDDLGRHIEDIWRMEITPYLEEYFFADRDKASAFEWERIRHRILGALQSDA